MRKGEGREVRGGARGEAEWHRREESRGASREGREGERARGRVGEWEGGGGRGGRRLDLLGQERLDELPALVQRPRRVEHTRAAEELRVVQVGEGHDRLEADEHAQRDVREANAAGVDDHELADEGAGLLRELVRVVRDILEDEVVDVKVLRVVEELEELVDVERAVVDEGHQVARLGAAVRV